MKFIGHIHFIGIYDLLVTRILLHIYDSFLQNYIILGIFEGIFVD